MSTRHSDDEAPALSGSSLAQRARMLVSLGRTGTLATHSRKFEGFPFGSLMPYAPDRFGRPVFLISTMAMHTQNLQYDWRASLLITQPSMEGDPLAAERVTLLGSVEQVSAGEVRGLYLDRHPTASQWADFNDFSFYRLYPSGIYFIGGFGVMGWISPGEYEISVDVE